MSKLDDFVEDVTTQSRSEFARAHPHAFLLLHLEHEDTGVDWSFKTTTVASKKINVAKLLEQDSIALSSESSRIRIFAVTKSNDNGWQERVSVGRARNNDIVLPHKSVSKLHAHFVANPDGTTGVLDAGSRNGTRVNDDKLAGDKPTRAQSGDTITFGAVALTFIDAEALYDLVKKHLRPRGRD